VPTCTSWLLFCTYCSVQRAGHWHCPIQPPGAGRVRGKGTTEKFEEGDWRAVSICSPSIELPGTRKCWQGQRGTGTPGLRLCSRNIARSCLLTSPVSYEQLFFSLLLPTSPSNLLMYSTLLLLPFLALRYAGRPWTGSLRGTRSATRPSTTASAPLRPPRGAPLHSWPWPGCCTRART